jgi:uncharacterized protein
MTGDMTGELQIDYEALAQDAMRGVVRAVLHKIAKGGLPGEHHFYIAFYTQHPGVIISKRIREKYPEEMTIVLQHRFWDLAVQEDRFEVKLTFDAIPERLVVPFDAVKVFFDPSVPYGLQFEEPGLGGNTQNYQHTGRHASDSDDYPERAEVEDGVPLRSNRTTPRNAASSDKTDKKPPVRKTKPVKAADIVADEPTAKPTPPLRKPALTPVPPVGDAKPAPTIAVVTPQNDSDKVIQLDKFRKK